jgi:hypothetical protein
MTGRTQSASLAAPPRGPAIRLYCSAGIMAAPLSPKLAGMRCLRKGTAAAARSGHPDELTHVAALQNRPVSLRQWGAA